MRLYAGWNCFGGLDYDFAVLKNLKVLSLPGNQFKEVPAVLGKLENLEDLDLGG